MEVIPEIKIKSTLYEKRGYLPFGTNEINRDGTVEFFVENGEDYTELDGTEWKISDESVAEITEVAFGGYYVTIRGLKEGTTTLTATFKGKSVSLEITTKKFGTLESLSFPQETYTKKVGEKLELFPDLHPADSYVENLDFYFTSSDPEVAWADIRSGVIRTKKEGTTVITVTYGRSPGYEGISTSYTLKVEGYSDNTEPEMLRYEPEDTHGILVGERVKPNIVVYPVTCKYNESDIKLTIVEQPTSDGGSAKIENGEIIGTSRGHVTIQASLDGCAPIEFTLYFFDID